MDESSRTDEPGIGDVSGHRGKQAWVENDETVAHSENTDGVGRRDDRGGVAALRLAAVARRGPQFPGRRRFRHRGEEAKGPTGASAATS